MRRTSAIAGACAVLAPLVLTCAPSASAASNGSLTITTLDRNGKAVTSQTQVIGANGDGIYTLSSGKAHSLPKGTYDVLASVDTGETETLAGAVVTVSGSAKVTIDARKGRQIRTTLSPAAGAGYTARDEATLCTSNGLALGVGGETDPGDFYVVPSSSRDFAIGYGTVWTPPEATGSYYLGTGGQSHGLPSGVSATFHRSSLAAVKISARSGPDSGYTDVGFTSGGNAPCLGGSLEMHIQTLLPTWFTAYVPAGSWSVSQTAQDFTSTNNHTYSAGKTYDVTLNHAVWGPDSDLPDTSSPGHRLYFGGMEMFTDPSLPYGGGGSTTAWKLSKAGKTLYSRTVSESDGDVNINPVIPSAGWYTVSADAKRSSYLAPLTGVLCTTSTLSLHFYANPDTNAQVRDYVARFWPDALNTSNQAAPGSTTPVVITPQRSRSSDPDYPQLSDAVKSVQAWDSTDGGKTWHAVTVAHTGSTWTASVHNPTTGRVALRSTITDSHGDSSTTTVYNAYAIG